MKLVIAGRSVTLHWAWLLVYLLLMSGLLRLGFWQLDRSGQKREFLARQEQALNAPPVSLNEQSQLTLADYEYRAVQVAGHYDAAHQFLIDNQVLDGKAGYWVMTPFILQDQATAILVNRGWLAANADRKQLPELSIQESIARIEGRINHFPAPGIKLAGGEKPGEQWPAVIQFVDSATLSQHLGYPLADFQIELDAAQAAGYTRRWKASTTISPEKHLGYAVQWFGLAATLSGLFIWLSLKKSS